MGKRKAVSLDDPTDNVVHFHSPAKWARDVQNRVAWVKARQAAQAARAPVCPICGDVMEVVDRHQSPETGERETWACMPYEPTSYRRRHPLKPGRRMGDEHYTGSLITFRVEPS